MFSNAFERIIRVLVSITPNGIRITNDSGIFNTLEPGDQVDVDKEFPRITQGVDDQNSVFIIPALIDNGRRSSR